MTSKQTAKKLQHAQKVFEKRQKLPLFPNKIILQS